VAGKVKLVAATAALIIVMVMAGQALALQSVTLVDGGSSFVDVSQRDLNLIKFQTTGVKAFTKSKSLDLRVDGENVFVSIAEGEAPAPQEVFFVTSKATFSLVLVPKAIPAETIVVKSQKEDVANALQWESSHDYITGLKDLIKSMYAGVAPMGFSVSDTGKDATKLAGTKELVEKLYKGATLTGEIHRVMNLSGTPLQISEQQFYQKGVLAVSINERDLQPMQDTEIYIVRKSETQSRMDKLQRGINPLDVVRQKR